MRAVLIAESDAGDATLIRMVLEGSKRYIAHTVTSRRDALINLSRVPYSALLVCSHLSDGTAVDLLTSMVPSPEVIPTILMVGRSSEEMIRPALTAGAMDVVTKSEIAIRALPRVIPRVLERHRLMCQIKDLGRQVAELESKGQNAMRTEIAQRDSYDAVTGLYSRQAFLQLLQSVRRRQMPVSIALIDIRNLHEFNAEYTEMEGDRLLNCVGTMLASELGSAEFAGRYDGDAVAIVVPANEKRIRGLIQHVDSELARLAKEQVLAGPVSLRSAWQTTSVASVTILHQVEKDLR